MKSIFPVLMLGWMVAVASNAGADEITFYGDFEDGFGDPPITYSSVDSYTPGEVVPLFHEPVVGIPKFDSTLGTLTGITVFVDASDPVLYAISGAMTVTETDDTLAEFGAAIDFFAGIELNYFGEGSVPFENVLAESIPMGGIGSASMGTGEFVAGITAGSDGMLTGSKSLFGSVDLADFVGSGAVDTLYVDLFTEDTAMFTLVNATATASLGFFDVFDLDSGADDEIIGVTYTFTAVPEPSGAGLMVLVLGFIGVGRKRRRVRRVE